MADNKILPRKEYTPERGFENAQRFLEAVAELEAPLLAIVNNTATLRDQALAIAGMGKASRAAKIALTCMYVNRLVAISPIYSLDGEVLYKTNIWTGNLCGQYREDRIASYMNHAKEHGEAIGRAQAAFTVDEFARTMEDSLRAKIGLWPEESNVKALAAFCGNEVDSLLSQQYEDEADERQQYARVLQQLPEAIRAAGEAALTCGEQLTGIDLDAAMAAEDAIDPPPPPAVTPAPMTPEELSDHGKLLGLVHDHPDWNKKQFAEAMGTSPTQLYVRYPQFKSMRRARRQARMGELPKRTQPDK